ncbi:MAG: phage holin family protein [Muribaculaceae bacterium]|nr:phage holin family protein [Muribaculaceae bacterium]
MSIFSNIFGSKDAGRAYTAPAPSFSDTLHAAVGKVLRLVQLNIESARLGVAEKVVTFLSAAALTGAKVILGALFLVFASVGVGHLLASSIAPHIAYLLVAAFYLLLFILLIIFRKQLIIDPISRFITRLFLPDPHTEEIKECRDKD